MSLCHTPRPRCPGCGSASTVYHWHWCLAPRWQQDAHGLAVQRVNEQNRLYDVAVAEAELLAMEIG